jgi:PKD repeat protein
VAEGASPVATAGDDEQPADISGDTPEVTVYFDASASYDPDGKIVQYDWDFDADGIFDHTSHSTPYAEQTFHYNGDYSVVLKVTDNGRYAQSGFGTGLVKVRNAKAEPKPLAANISAFPPFGPAALTVNLAAAVTGGAPPYKYTWTFSDGSESALPNPFTTYPEPSSHNIKFSVTDVAGDSLSGSLLVDVQDRESPATPQPRMELDVSPSSERGNAPLTAKFQLQVSRATEPVTYRVTFGDETPGLPETVTGDTFLTHYYGMSGFYLVKVIATDADLRTASTFATVHVQSPDIERDFTLSMPGTGSDPFSFGHGMHIGFDYTLASPRTVRFSPEDPPADEKALAFQWDFGDGTYSTEAKPEHTYAKDGVYEVRLTGNDGLQRFRHRVWLPVSADDPAVAIQRPAYIEGPAPLAVDLDAIVTRGEQPFRYDWIIGTARRSDAKVSHVFQTPGDYEIRLDVYDKWHEVMHAPPIEVRVRPGPVSYNLSLAVIEPLAGSTRATVMETNGANPLPLSSPHVEGAATLVDLSSDGQRLAIAGKETLIVKLVRNGDPVLAFLPAAGEISAVRALDTDAALCTVESAGGRETYLLRPETSPVLVGGGLLLSASAMGNTVVLGPEPDFGATRARLFHLDSAAGQVSQGEELPELSEAQLTADGRELFFINSEQRLVKRVLATGTDDYLGKGEDRKTGLAVSADGTAVAFISSVGDEQDIIYGRYTQEGEFRLASVTDMTGFFSEQLRLSAGGDMLFGYGSRTELYALLDEARGTTVADDEAVAEGEELAAEDGDKAVALEEQHEARPPARRERFGIISMDLSGSPDRWKITTVGAKWITEASAVFDASGPFER